MSAQQNTPIYPINRDSVLQALANHIGQERAAHATALVGEIMGAVDDIDHPLRVLRHTIVALRCDGYHVCGHPGFGYYMAENAAEINRTCEFLYSRSMTTLQQVAAMKRVSLPDLRGQLRLPE